MDQYGTRHGSGLDEDAERERRLGLLIARLPAGMQRLVKRVRQPEARLVRIPLGILFILGGFLFILPVLGLWMLPLGIVLLADDIPFLRRMTGRWLEWIERRHPTWLKAS